MHTPGPAPAPSPAASALAIVEAVHPDQVAQARELFLAYARSLHFSLCFQGFDQELAGLPGDYGRPRGRLLLGLNAGRPVGCVALRPLEGGACEMKRLYVAPEARGTGLGPLLAHRIVTEAQAEGYTAMRLDTVPQMAAAIALYRRMGFREIGNYNANPLPEALFFELALRG